MNDFDNKHFINEIKIRPALWDLRTDDYRDKCKKKRLWREVYIAVYPDYNKLSLEEKDILGKLVQKRWKNLRACFSRELREQKSTKSGHAAKQRRKYKHFYQLLFLVSSMDTRETSGNANSVEEIDCEEDSTDSDEDVPKRSEYSRKKNTSKIPYEEKLLDVLNKKRADENKFIEAVRNNKSKCDDDDDREKHFALSLVPLFKSVPEENRLEVQIRILKIFQEFQKQNSHRMVQLSHSSEQPQEQVSRRASTPRCRSATSNSIQSYVPQFTPDYNEDSKVNDIQQEYNINTGNH